ncbi:MAG TPA: universal stress protein [Fulvivirga sp.]|nr:universal stress protein [Fulvivirga sp.]
MKKIFVPTDFSDISKSALKLAVDIGRYSNSEIYLVNFMKHPFGRTFSTTGEIRDLSNTEKNLFTLELVRKNQSRLAKLADQYGISVKIQYQVYNEEFTDGFEDYIKTNNIDLVVMGTSGEESIEEFFSGNHTIQMIEKATCPVISLKDEYKDMDFKNIIVGIDLEKDSNDNFTQAAVFLNDFAKSVHGKLHLVHVADLNANKSELEKKVNDFATKHGFKNFTVTIIQNDNKGHGLVNYSNTMKTSIIAILTHAEGGLLRKFYKSTADELSKTSSLPVMSINLHNI